MQCIKLGWVLVQTHSYKTSLRDILATFSLDRILAGI